MVCGLVGLMETDSNMGDVSSFGFVSVNGVVCTDVSCLIGKMGHVARDAVRNVGHNGPVLLHDGFSDVLSYILFVQ